MTTLTDMAAEVDRIASGFVSRALAKQEEWVSSALEEALMAGAIRGEVAVVLVYDLRLPFPRMRARLV